RDARAGQGVLRRQVRPVDPARAAPPGLHLARLGGPVRGAPGRTGPRRAPAPAVEPPAGRGRRRAAPAGPGDETAHRARAVRSRHAMTAAQIGAIVAVLLPPPAIVLWPLLRARGAAGAA